MLYAFLDVYILICKIRYILYILHILYDYTVSPLNTDELHSESTFIKSNLFLSPAKFA